MSVWRHQYIVACLLTLLSRCPLSRAAYCEFYPSCDFYGYDLVDKQQLTDTVAGCCDLCASIPECKVWSWEIGSHRCLPKTSGADKRSNTNDMCGTTTSAAATACNAVAWIDFTGNDISGMSRLTDTAMQCCEYCTSISNCKFWTWDAGGLNCYPKTSNSGRSTSVLKISGSASSVVGYECNLGVNCDYNGYDFTSLQKVTDTAGQCCDYCGSIPGCRAWTWQMGGKRCLPKYSASGYRSLTGDICGTSPSTGVLFVYVASYADYWASARK